MATTLEIENVGKQISALPDQWLFREVTASITEPDIIGIMMIGVASWNAASRGERLPGIFWRIVVTPTPQYLFPMSDMIIGSAMVVCSLYLSHMNRETESSRGEIEVLLCLGATPRQAIHSFLKRAVKASMIPTFDSMKTIGLVQLPGMMTGMIVAGASPVEAVRYQILIMLTFSSSAAISAVLISLFSYRLWFTRESFLRG
ncbi:ABC transporter permease [Brevibacillus sp. GCM10020057]|uniref:ABC transporter permease n=1 Tax=Brevibacillus sp. GCM10020057 TaxID=3317327 RepID=UPI003639ABAC